MQTPHTTSLLSHSIWSSLLETNVFVFSCYTCLYESTGDFFSLHFLFKLLPITYEFSKQKQITGILATEQVLLLEIACSALLLSSSQW